MTSLFPPSSSTSPSESPSSEFTFLPYIPLLCKCVPEVPAVLEHQIEYYAKQNAILRKDLKALYEYHLEGESKCVWFLRAQRLYADQWVKQHEQSLQKKAREKRAQQKAKEEEEARLIKATEATEDFKCRRCPAKFSSNTKLHEHVREHHAKKPAASEPASEMTSSLSFSTIASIETAPITASITSTLQEKELQELRQANSQLQDHNKELTKQMQQLQQRLEAPSAPFAPPAPPAPPAPSAPSAPSTPPTSPSKAKALSWAKIASKNLPSTPPPTPPRSPVIPYQKSKPTYMTIHDLFRMFGNKKPPRQTSITSYLKPTSKSTPKMASFLPTPAHATMHAKPTFEGPCKRSKPHLSAPHQVSQARAWKKSYNYNANKVESSRQLPTSSCHGLCNYPARHISKSSNSHLTEPFDFYASRFN